MWACRSRFRSEAIFDSSVHDASDFEEVEELSDRRMKECKIRMKKKREYGFARI